MIRAVGIVFVSSMLVPAAAGTSMPRPSVALTASPARLALTGSGHAAIHVTNTGSLPVVVDARRAGFALDLRGRPRIVPGGGPRAADSWLTLLPNRLTLRPGARGAVTVASRVPRRAEPGDHDALLLLTTRPRRAAGLAVRMRIGIVVVVRAPGRIVRRLELRGIRVRRAVRSRSLELVVVNRGNTTEALGRDRLGIALRRRGRVLARLWPTARDLRPRTTGIVQLTYRGGARGWVTARVTVSTGPDGVIRRTYRIRL